MRSSFLLLIVFILNSCDHNVKQITAQDIIDKSIETSCSGKCDQATIEFTFRDRSYISKRDGGSFEFQRTTTTALDGITKDILNNTGFKRFRNDTLLKTPDSMAEKYSSSVNSVHYFAQLPFGLNDSAVQKDLLDEDNINGNIYYEIGVSFIEEGGGDDYTDTFVYWIHKENFTVDYLAYKYSDDGGGIRFREAFNERVVNGIRFVDYNNYKPISPNVELEELDDLFTEGKLILLSKIEIESINVLLDE